MPPTKSTIERLAELCRQAAPDLEAAVTAFEKLKAQIEREGYQVIWHIHSNEYSLRKL